VAGRTGRIDGLDALRGFAIFGILLINIQLFSGFGFVATETRESLSLSGVDKELQAVLDLLVRERFYSLFSLLFGYSFGMLANKWKAAAVSMHLRRMAGLIVFGLAHTMLLWPWDILLLYGLVGLVLAAFLHQSPRALFGWSLGLLLVTGVLRWYWVGPSPGYGEFSSRMLEESVPKMAGGTYLDVLEANVYVTAGVFVNWIESLRPLRVLTLFLLGAAAAGLQLARPGSGRTGLLRLAAAIGLAGGLAAGLTAMWVEPESQLRELVVVGAETVAAPLLAVGYGATLTLWWQGNGAMAAATRAAFAPVGRMALTNYILQSAVFVPVFYDFGGGWFAEISLARLLLMSAGFFVLQMIFSALWLSRFRQGPLEFLWRWQVQGARPPFQKR
jgi:uncharacterized protein